MTGLRRVLRLWAASLRVSVMAALEYRVGFWTEGVVGLAWSLGGVVPLLVALDHRSDVAGWTPWQVVLLTGFFLIISGTFASSVRPAVSEAMSQIRRGSFDYVLLRPVDALVSSLLVAFEPWSLIELLTGVGLVITAAIQLDLQPTLAQVAGLAVALASGIASLYALGVLILAASFRALELQNLTFLLETLLDFARWPVSVFRGPFKLVFTFVIPFAVMTSYPAQSLLHGLAAAQVFGAVGTTVGLLVLARWAWVRGVRGYTSASS
jgi:ABC-2 type transport system permease protein